MHRTMPPERLITPLEAIRDKCLECCFGSTSEVENCNFYACPLFPFRKGTYPAGYQRLIVSMHDAKTD